MVKLIKKSPGYTKLASVLQRAPTCRCASAVCDGDEFSTGQVHVATRAQAQAHPKRV